ncbi:MAG: hypothetical protein OEY94_06450, partial [Alphaproteobacteria bacterium]|nr:hypothetical protein [Alphaproteobacteria bacterium]
PLVIPVAPPRHPRESGDPVIPNSRITFSFASLSEMTRIEPTHITQKTRLRGSSIHFSYFDF